MHVAIYLPLIVPLLAAAAARPLAERLPPRTAAWLLTGAAVALAVASSAVLGLLAMAAAVMVAIGVAAAPWLIDVIAAGFKGSTRVLTIHLVRIFFPGAGLLVISAWCLSVLNSHRHFFLSYAAPVIWNGAIIAALVIFGGRWGRFDLAEWVALGAVVGAALQVAIQWPTVRRILGPLRLSLNHRLPHVREVIRNSTPAFASRGVIQISSYVDAFLASYLPTGAMAALGR
ncbi:MAG: lipid II flippase MurJ [Streptosporangiaceae bacterium]